ncbi:MAG: 3-deoxy-D-manno-octulosonic acid transferase [Epsilonproteobacteria bacterium]|nr:3-deoxy-D-manno-octulosonic acid transferase [Campylobacterota bacterium]NPA56458.1 3-deoxy-D-manno-octulosonic acid transferase [Campylobacterota bacterium]
MFFPYIYTLLTALALIVTSPLLLIIAIRQKYRRSIPARFFLFRNSPFPEGGVHFHACSFGEVRALAPLIERTERPRISVITQTGFDEAQKYGGEVRFLPFEPWLWLWLKPQKALVVAEAELWFLLFFLAKRRGAKTILVNARISDPSYPKYRRFQWFYREIFNYVDVVFAQTEEDRKRLEELGAKRVEVTGNLKLLVQPKPTRRYRKSSSLITAASTHDPEEEIIATAWIEAGAPGTLVVVPRHPERFDEVDELLSHIARREGLSYHRLRDREELDSKLVLADRMGELVNIYGSSDLVILGGSFIPDVGGHNPIEPASLGVPIISGPYYHNQRATYQAVQGIKIVEGEKLSEALLTPPPPPKIQEKIDLEPIYRELEDVV